MKIGLVTPAWPGSDTPNGICTSVYYLAHGLRECGCEVIVLTFVRDGPSEEISVVQAPPAHWSFSKKLRHKFNMLMANDTVVIEVQADRIVTAARKAIDRHGLDVIIVEETQGWGNYLRRELPLPVVITLHGPWFILEPLRGERKTIFDYRRERRESAALLNIAGITAPSSAVFSAVRSEVELPNDILQAVIPNAISVPVEVNRTRADKREKPSMLFVGRFDRIKGGDTIIQSFEALGASHPEVQLTFVGPDRGIPKADGSVLGIHDALNKMPANIRERIFYLGQCSKSQILALRRAHGITLIGSRYETLGYTLLEAMAHGSAIVATDVGGPSEVLVHNETALLVPPDDPGAMAAACKHLLDDPKLRFRLGSAAREVALRDFQPKVVGEKMATFLEHVIAHHAHRQTRV